MAKKSFLDSIKVPAPCDKNWEEMIGGEQKRFCSGCQKNVYNISAMPRREARKLVAQNAGKICIRYARLSNGQVETTDRKLYSISRRTSAVAAGVVAATLTLSAMTYAQGEPVIGTTQATVNSKTKNQKSISFTVLDEMGAVIPDTQIKLTNQKTKKMFEKLASHEGVARFDSIPYGNYLISTVSGINGFPDYNEIIEINKLTKSTVEIILKINPQFVTGDFIIDESAVPLKKEKFNKLKDGINSRQNKSSSEISQISFTIYDQTGAIIPSTQITLTNRKTKAEFNSTTDQNGTAQFGLIPHGLYDLFISGNGFMDYKEAVQLKEAIEPNIKITLNIAFIGEIMDNWSEIPLFQAIVQEDNETVERLINLGFDVNTKDSSGKMALHVAVEHENLEIVRFLLGKNAKVNAKDKDKISPLLMLEDNLDGKNQNAVEILHLLIATGADVNARNEDKKTLLMLACDAENLGIVKLLLETKANPNLKDGDGETALEKTESAEIKSLLRSYGAR